METLSVWKSLRFVVWGRVNTLLACYASTTFRFFFCNQKSRYITKVIRTLVDAIEGPFVCLIVWCLTWFLTLFQLHVDGSSQCTYVCFPRGSCDQHTVHYSFQATFQQNHCRNMVSSDRRIHLVAMTIISPQKEYWPSRESNQRPLLKCCSLTI